MIPSVWDGDSKNRNSDSGTLSSPDWRDWDEVIRQVALTQTQVIGLNGLTFEYNDADTTTIKAGGNLITIINSTPWVRFGGLSNYSEFEADGTLKFAGNATVWDDLRVPLSATRVGPTQVPDFSQVADDGGSSVGVYAYIFPDSALKQLFFAMQMPHSYKFGSDIYPHVHWLPQTTDTGTVNWQLEYTIANIDSVMGNTTTIQMPDAGAGTINTHQRADSASPISGTGLTLSNMLLGRLFRDGGQGADTFTGDAALLEFDVHFEKDTVGSRQDAIK